MRIATRPPIERMAAIDRAIRAGDYPNARTIGLELEVSPRTIQRDIEFLRDRMEAPIAYDAWHHGYHYADATYQLALPSLTDKELVALVLGERALRQFQGTPYAADIARALRKITVGLTDPASFTPEHLDGSYSFRTTAPAIIDPALFLNLAAALHQHHHLIIHYATASRGEITQRRIDPYHIASVDGQWYVIAYCHLRKDVRIFVPARIQSLETTDESFDIPADFRVEDYLARSFSVFRGDPGERHQIRIRFRSPTARFVAERTWHASQTIETTPEGDLIVGLSLSHLREVERWVLSWGADAEVLEPPELRERVAETLESAVRKYLGE